MTSRVLRANPVTLTGAGIFGGIALIATGLPALAVAGGALIALGLLVPFMRLMVGRTRTESSATEQASTDRLWAAVSQAPLDDEPLSPDTARAIATARQEYRANEIILLADERDRRRQAGRPRSAH